MDLDPVRVRIMKLLQTKGTDMKAASLAIGKNAAYLQQFLFRGTPKNLSEETRGALALFLDVAEEELEHRFALPKEARRPAPRMAPVPRLSPQDDEPADDIVEVAEVEVRAAAGAGALNEDEPDVLWTWPLPRSLIEQELRVPAHALKIISVRGDSMLPTLSDGDRIMVDTSHRHASPPGIYVLWDGAGLVAKRVDITPGDPPLVRLHSDNDLYSAYDCHPDEIRIVGRVVWAAKRF